MVAHPLCIQNPDVDAYEMQCVSLVYKAAFGKLRQAVANPMYANMVANMTNITIAKASLSSSVSQLCQTEFTALFKESLNHSNGVPWIRPFRTPQVMVGPKESSPDVPKKAFVSSGPAMRSISLWSDDDLSLPYAQPGSSRLKSPRSIADFLEANWKTFLSELDDIPANLWTDPYLFLNPVKDGWSVYVLYKNRTFDDDRCKYTPRTCGLVKSVLPATNLPFFHIYNEEAGFFSNEPRCRHCST